MAKQLPDLSPFIASDLMCPTCSDLIKPKAIKNERTGAVLRLEYRHENRDFGCAYIVESNAMVNAETKPLRQLPAAVIA